MPELRSLPLVDASGTLTEGADGEKDPAEAGSLSFAPNRPHIRRRQLGGPVDYCMSRIHAETSSFLLSDKTQCS
jgi:hypothetical protein